MVGRPEKKINGIKTFYYISVKMNKHYDMFTAYMYWFNIESTSQMVVE